eukprot:CAMPEP_0179233062 /NCGR_PEP_ID=MMETSP0797-20121207/12178_1 /TAXON_ID=47934 /ORGANISM="Dinophysis acuminata, Strain DAEP01" /LENGTH=661 /DNA_ID=CAMNT_0020940195 /DNA_START=54 /DNA_END=2040 /DNA_ORIENTATION=+
MVQLWEVIGGGDKGGIIVKDGEDFGSVHLKDRLSTGAIIEELELKGERLHYALRTGTGPSRGWISTKLPNKDLAVRVEGPPAALHRQDQTWPRPSGLPPIVSEEAPAMRLLKDMSDEEWERQPKRTWPHPNYNRKQHPAMAAKDVTGKFFGLVFPYTIDKIREGGPEWLTLAFHAAGTLPKSNRVVTLEVIPVSVDPMEGEAVGGSSIKAKLVVGYERNAPGLHTEMFVKLPLDPTPESERVYNGKNWWLDEPEGLINLVAQACPFRAAKCYFWDFSPESTNFIHIWESYDFSDQFEPGVPWVICKPGLKCKDYMLPGDGLTRYVALMKALGRMAAAYQLGKLGDKHRLVQVFEGLECTLDEHLQMQNDVTGWPIGEEARKTREKMVANEAYIKGAMEDMERNKGMGELMLCSGVTLLMHVCPQLFPKEKVTKQFLMRLYKEALHVQLYKTEIQWFACQYKECFSLMHPNTQLDNGIYYYTDEACTNMECSIIDWAAANGGPFLMGIASNLLSGAEPRMLESHFHDIVRALLDSYWEAGGSRRLTHEYVSTTIKLGMADATSGLMGFTRIIQNNMPPHDPRWKKFKDRWDPEINDNYVRRATIAQCNHLLESWDGKLDLYGNFKQWLAANERILVKKPMEEPRCPDPPREPAPKAKAKSKP